MRKRYKRTTIYDQWRHAVFPKHAKPDITVVRGYEIKITDWKFDGYGTKVDYEVAHKGINMLRMQQRMDRYLQESLSRSFAVCETFTQENNTDG